MGRRHQTHHVGERILGTHQGQTQGLTSLRGAFLVLSKYLLVLLESQRGAMTACTVGVDAARGTPDDPKGHKAAQPRHIQCIFSMFSC